ncbi:AcrR family transcriptional regulator [Catenuloplanes nepalensis]|uniref:AcrR family transcriptional regulator n=1 Tax=Catenuloplanes nepalensis TaxID=587533 RepID=A0ABT9MPC3_9ACTN|nr:TetR/AcrR family transcriptional regulator [Catenuloplanes nepalensis]MDP9793282.1 AcrR family transcriptional regulator [Catenuloplanes nepalensis]
MEDIRKAPVGRPRGFDTDEALERAMVTFWKEGYDGVSLSELARAMGITKTSLYAAFGTKEDLFRRALERYAEGPASYAARALTEPTAQDVARAYLSGAVAASTCADRPAGCLGVQGVLAAGHLGESARAALLGWREEDRSRLSARFQRAVTEGDLPADADPDILTRYLMTMANGIAVQAAGGVPRDDLQRMADTLTQAFPPR